MLGLPTPYVIGGLLLIGFIGGYKVKDWQCDAAYSKVLEQAAKQKEQMQGIVDAKSRALEEARNRADVQSVVRTNTVREIYKSVPAPRSECAPPPAALGVLLESISDPDGSKSSGKSGQ